MTWLCCLPKLEDQDVLARRNFALSDYLDAKGEYQPYSAALILNSEYLKNVIYYNILYINYFYTSLPFLFFIVIIDPDSFNLARGVTGMNNVENREALKKLQQWRENSEWLSSKGFTDELKQLRWSCMQLKTWYAT
jgi:hypothetical protein